MSPNPEPGGKNVVQWIKGREFLNIEAIGIEQQVKESFQSQGFDSDDEKLANKSNPGGYKFMNSSSRFGSS